VQPCGSLPSSSGQVCSGANNQQQCYSAPGSYSADKLGAASAAVWTPLVAGDWSQGASSSNTDVSDYDECYYQSSSSMVVNYICGAYGNNTVTVTSEPANPYSTCSFVLTVDSSIVCAALKGGGGASPGLRSGWIFVIIVVVVLFTYFAVGISYNHFKLGLSGTEMVPNIAFWRDLPGLVKDGCMFTFTKIKALVQRIKGDAPMAVSGTGSSYETI